MIKSGPPLKRRRHVTLDAINAEPCLAVRWLSRCIILLAMATEAFNGRTDIFLDLLVDMA
jgi:hypothetical protein